MPWARTRSEMDYLRRMSPIVDDVLPNVVTYPHARDADVPLLFDRCFNCYWYRGWVVWIYDASFARQLCPRNKQEESVFTGWHNKEILAVTIARRPELHELVTE